MNNRNAQLIRENINSVIKGKPEVVKLTLTVLLAEGHLVLEDVPGVSHLAQGHLE